MLEAEKTGGSLKERPMRPARAKSSSKPKPKIRKVEILFMLETVFVFEARVIPYTAGITLGFRAGNPIFPGITGVRGGRAPKRRLSIAKNRIPCYNSPRCKFFSGEFPQPLLVFVRKLREKK